MCLSLPLSLSFSLSFVLSTTKNSKQVNVRKSKRPRIYRCLRILDVEWVYQALTMSWRHHEQRKPLTWEVKAFHKTLYLATLFHVICWSTWYRKETYHNITSYLLLRIWYRLSMLVNSRLHLAIGKLSRPIWIPRYFRGDHMWHSANPLEALRYDIERWNCRFAQASLQHCCQLINTVFNSGVSYITHNSTVCWRVCSDNKNT